MDSVDNTCILTRYEDSEVKLDPNGKEIEVIISKKSDSCCKDDLGEVQTHLYPKRFLIMSIFCLYSMSSAFQWIEYAIIMDIMIKYYDDANTLSIAWTSMIYMLSYIPLMFVATWMLDNWGLRKILLFGAMLNAIGALIKIPSVSPDLFALSFVGQTFAACAQSFILEMPPKIASLWFGPSEVSTATAVGVFGNQLGVALGFVIPPMLVPNSDDKDEIAVGLRILFISSAVACTLVLFLIFAVIRDQPPIPPSKARALAAVAESNNQAKNSSLKNYRRSIGVLVKNVPFLLLFVTYGVNTGTYYAIGTLLNPIMLEYHPDAGKDIGIIGLVMVVAGLGGSVLCGYILDKTKYYKITTVLVYVLSMAFMFVFTFTLSLPKLWIDYLSIGLLGFFMTGYLPIGFEFAAEITYPESEATSSGLLNVSAQFFGILFTLVAGELMTSFGSFYANLFMCIALLIGTVLTFLIKENLKRQAAESQRKNEDSDSDIPSVTFTSNHNSNQNNNNKEEEEERLLRLESASSFYSTSNQ